MRSPWARNLCDRRGHSPSSSASAWTSSGESSPAKTGSAQPSSRTARSVADLDLQLAPFELDHDRAGGAAQEGGDRGAAGAGAGGERLPHAALEDPRPHPAAVDREEGDVGAVGEQLVAFDPRPDLAEVEVVELLRSTTIAHCGLPIETCWNSHSRPPLSSVPRPSSGPGGEVLGGGRGPAHVDRAGQLAGDRRPDRPGDGADRELVVVGPAVAAQVEDRLAGAVARELGLGAVGVEDPQLGDELGVVAAREQQDPVGADAEMRVAEPLDPGRAQLPGQPLLPRRSGSRCPAPATSRISRAGAYSLRPPRASLRPVRSIQCRFGILRIQVSWRRA